MNITYMVVDDEPLARQRIILQIAEHNRWQLAGQAQSADEAIELLESKKVDVCFLDQTLINSEGLDVVEYIRKHQLATEIVFATATRDLAIDAYTYGVVDYLLKPVSQPRLEQCINKLEGMISAESELPGTDSDHIAVKSLGKIELIAIDDILWIHGASNYIELHLEDRMVLHRESLNRLEGRLPGSSFLRVHRSSIVNLKKIQYINSEVGRYNLLSMCNGDEVKISHAYRKALFKRLGMEAA